MIELLRALGLFELLVCVLGWNVFNEIKPTVVIFKCQQVNAEYLSIDCKIKRIHAFVDFKAIKVSI